MAFIDDVKAYCGTDDDIKSFVDAAEIYLTNAEIAKNESNALYALAVKMLVSHWYDHREVVGSANKLAFGLDCLITQLKYSQAVT